MSQQPTDILDWPATVTLNGLLDAIVAGDPLALPIAKDYALDHLGANTPEEATARLIDVAADRGMDTLRIVMARMGRHLSVCARLISAGEISPAEGENWIAAGTDARVLSRNQRDGTVSVYGTARVLSRNQQGGTVYAYDTARVLSRNQRIGSVYAHDTSRVLSRNQQGGLMYAVGAARVRSHNQQGGYVVVHNTSCVLSCD
jgi:predicted GNAT family acetyltransferase